MLSEIWNAALINPILNVLVGFYHLTGNLGISIILLTLLVRTVLIPVMLPALKNMKKQRELKPELDEIKEKYKDDKKKQAEAQMELFKKHGLNPASGCVTQIPMFLVLIAVYGVIRKISMTADIAELNSHLYFDQLKIMADSIDTSFLFMDLAESASDVFAGFNADSIRAVLPYSIIPILAGLFQFVASKISYGLTKKGEELAEKTPDKSDDLAYNVQEQMLYLMPVMTLIIGFSLPAGAVLYILVTTLFSLVQSYIVHGRD